MARKRVPPFETEIVALGAKGVGVGRAPDGKEIHVRGAAPGARVRVIPAGRRKRRWIGRKDRTIRPPVGGVAPACALFGLCGGCVLQELGLEGQRQAKEAYALGEFVRAGGALQGVMVHGLRGAEAAYGYRNKVELSFGPARYLSEADMAAGVPIAGRFLGMHAAGRFDRVVDAPRCELVSEPMNQLLAGVREVALHEDAPPPRDSRSGEGFWRHAMLREAAATGELLLTLYTTSPTSEQAVWVERVAERVAGLVVGTVWCVNDGVADVARGAVRKVWGRDWIEERLGEVSFRLSVDSFFQTNTPAAAVLYDTVGEALGRGASSDTLLDLYCGIGSIGLVLADRVSQVVGIEEVEAAVVDARANAERNKVNATFRAAKVEHVLDQVEGGEGVRIVVDPPRAGLHPKVARKLAQTHAEVLVYVACHPGSLGRDALVLREGGWTLTDLWPVDLFPQTGHIEVVGRFVRLPTDQGTEPQESAAG